MPLLYYFLMDLFDLIFPKKCLGCGRAGKYICERCLKAAEKAYLVCPVCKNFSVSGATHSYCNSKTSLDGVVAIFRYEGIIKKAVKRIKYNFNFDIASELANLVSPEIRGFAGFVVVPIPIHSSRQRWRGFNQAQILGQSIAKNLGLEYQKDLLTKVKKTPQQVGLHRSERLRSIRGVFAVNAKTVPENILLFDDVWTTGATLNEAAKVLKKAGAKTIWGLTIAR